MYNETVLSVGVIENGYVIEFRKPLKDDDKKECPCYSSENKTAFFKTEAEVSAVIAKMLPKLKESDPEDEFDSAFEESIK